MKIVRVIFDGGERGKEIINNYVKSYDGARIGEHPDERIWDNPSSELCTSLAFAFIYEPVVIEVHLEEGPELDD